jgi:hypothetical protein
MRLRRLFVFKQKNTPKKQWEYFLRYKKLKLNSGFLFFLVDAFDAGSANRCFFAVNFFGLQIDIHAAFGGNVGVTDTITHDSLSSTS